MDPTTTSTFEEMMRCLTKVKAMEEENRNLKLKNIELTQELENTTKVQALEEENKNLKLKNIELTRELENKKTRENICVCLERQEEQTPEKTRMSGSVLAMTSEGANSSLNEILVNDERVFEFEDNLQTQTPSMDEDLQIHIKEEDVGYGQSKTPSADEDMQIDIKEEDVGYGQSKSKSDDCDNYIHDPPLLDPSGDFGPEVGTDCELNLSSATELTRNVLCQEIVKAQPHSRAVSRHRRKEPHLTTRPAQKIHKCENCSAAFETQFKLRVHNTKPHTGRKKSRPSVHHKTPLKCSVCGTSCATKRLLTIHKESHAGEKSARTLQIPKELPAKRSLPVIHKKSHTAEKSAMTLQIPKELPAKRSLPVIHKKSHIGEKSARTPQIDMELPAKRRLTVENEKLSPAGRPTKQRKIENETEVSNDEEMSVVRDRIDPPCVVELEEGNPFKIKKILERILSNLGKRDLLNARMVCRAWNEESLEVLWNSKFTQRLIWNEEKVEPIVRYLRFIRKHRRFTTPNERPFIMPFHLHFYIHSPSYSLFSGRIHKYVSQVDSLYQIFGPQCVSTLTLNTYDCSDTDLTEENVKQICLIDILALISCGLETLNFERFNVGIDFLKNQLITFPKLKKLICDTRRCESGRRGSGPAYISILENSPNLEDLTLTHPCDLDSWPLKFNQLKSLSFEMFKPQNILDKILSSSGSPVLRELSIGSLFVESWSAEDKIVVYNILNSVSSTLKSLKFPRFLLPLCKGNPRFPKLPHLEYLELRYHFDDPSYNKYIDFSPEKIPSLKSIEVSTPSASPVPSEEDKGVRIEFPNLIKLTLRVEIFEPEDGALVVRYLQQIFPTPSRLCLVNGRRGNVKYVLHQIVKSNWSKSVQEIEMIGHWQKDLGGIMNQLDFSPWVDIGEWMLTLTESFKTGVKNSWKFGTHVRGSIILRRTNQVDCQIKK